MKKVLVSLLVLALAMTSVFAAVNFSGELVTGYTFNYDKDSEEWTNWMYGQDNLDTNSTQLKLGIADDNGVWSIGLEGALFTDGSSSPYYGSDTNGDDVYDAISEPMQNRVAGDITIDLAKLIMGDTDWTAQLQLLANDRVTALRAYSNQSGLNYDRVRTAEPGLWANAIVGYGDLLQVQIGGAPALQAGANKAGNVVIDVDGTKTGGTYGDLIISAMTKPISGLAVSVDWALVGDYSADFDLDNNPDTKEDNFTLVASTESKTAGVFGAAAEVNLGEMLGLSFDLGVGVADKYYYGENVKNNVLAAQVYGGIDLVSAYVEYVNSYSDNAETAISMIHAGVDLNVIENMILNAYFGASDLSEEVGDVSYYVGGNVGYELSGITFQVNLQYAEGGYASSVGGDVAQGAVKAEGFSITPMLKLSF